MKSIVMPVSEQLEKNNEQLSQEVKETLATTANVNIKTKFTAVDMWNRHRNRRSASDRMRKWNLN